MSHVPLLVSFKV